MRERIDFFFLNLGHFLDHLFVLIIATVAALGLAAEWGTTWDALIPYATPCFVAFGLGAIPAGWLADKWSRPGMMILFFVGIGLASILAGFTSNKWELMAALLLMGLFASIYHPVGIAMVVHGREKTGVALAVNGVWGNLGVASAALIGGFMVEHFGWRAAFFLPGGFAILTGIAYAAFLWTGRAQAAADIASGVAARKAAAGTVEVDAAVLKRIFAVILVTTALGSLIFQMTTFSLPKIFDERLGDLAANPTQVGWWAFVVFTLAAFAQLVVGYLIDRHSIRTVFLIVSGLQPPLFAGMMYLFGVPALFVALGFMLLVFGQIPINDALIARVTKSQWRSRAYSVRLFIGFGISSTAIPLIAWQHHHWGFVSVFLTMAVLSALIVLAVARLPDTAEMAGRSAAVPAE